MERVGLQAPVGWVVLVAVAGGCWGLTLAMAGDVGGGGEAGAALAGGGALLAMWMVMMAAMMLPSLVPALRGLARVEAARGGGGGGGVGGRVVAFGGGYLLWWGGFSVAAAAVQWAAAAAGLLDAGSMALNSPALAAGVVAAAGGFQFSSLKRRCLRGCREPFWVFLLHWRDGAGGAARMGMRYGALCVGCCALLMALLFVGGVMNVAWIVALTLYAVLEKMLPVPQQAMARVTGAVLLAAAAGLALQAAGVF